MMVDTLKLHSEAAANRREMMKTQDDDYIWAEWAASINQDAPITGGAGQEIIAAIITAGMLLPLPVAKLRRLAADPITSEKLDAALKALSNALHMYINVSQTLRYADARLAEARARPTMAQ
jgi:hypothetical protein